MLNLRSTCARFCEKGIIYILDIYYICINIHVLPQLEIATLWLDLQVPADWGRGRVGGATVLCDPNGNDIVSSRVAIELIGSEYTEEMTKS